MFVTKNRAGVSAVLFLLLAVFVVACAPPGPRALLQGRKLLEAGETDAALLPLQTATTIMPTNAAAWNYLGLAWHRAGQVTNAVEAYSRAIKLDRDLLEARFNLGCLWLEAGRLDAAKSEFTAYTLLRGPAVEGWLKLGAVQWRGREFAGAEKSFREALRIETNNVEALNGLGLVQLHRGRPREARDLFTQALGWQPDYRPALLNLATVAQQTNDRTEALRRYREYLALQPRAADWEAVNAIVKSLEPPGVTMAPPVSQPVPASNKLVAVAVVTNPPKPETATARQPIASKPNANVNAPKPATPTVAQTPPKPEVVKLSPAPVVKAAPSEPAKPVSKANSIARETNLSNSTTATKSNQPASLAKLNPVRSEPKPETRTETAIVSTPPPTAPPATGRYAYVAPAAPKAGNRREAEFAFVQGQQFKQANNLAEALQSFRRATQLDPAYYEAYYSLGVTAYRLRNYSVALGAWEHAIALRPNDAEARYNFALTLKAADHPQDAVNELEKLLVLHPDEARSHLTLGNIYAEERDIPRARRHYTKVLQLDPGNSQAQTIRYWLVANPG